MNQYLLTKLKVKYFIVPNGNECFMLPFIFRHIYDLQQRHYPSKTILIGSTHVIKPTTFLQEIQNGVNLLNPCTDYSDITVE